MAKATLKPKATKSSSAANTRGPSFFISEDVFTSIWATHNEKWTENAKMSMDEEGQYDCFVDFCFKVFCASIDAEEAERCGCKGTKVNDVTAFKNKLPKLWGGNNVMNDFFERKDHIYDFMKDRCMRKATDLLPQINEFVEGVKLPVGMEYADWMTSDRRNAKMYALKFM
jgi:hypothetical protein